jgi:hypothetical protein
VDTGAPRGGEPRVPDFRSHAQGPPDRFRTHTRRLTTSQRLSPPLRGGVCGWVVGGWGVEEIERKRKEAAARQMATGKRKHGETPTPSWGSRDMEIEVGNQETDGLILDTEESAERAIYIIEGA